MKLYGVVTMDIVDSRKIKDRESIQLKLNQYIEELNEKYATILLAPITITLGDEWQLVTDHPWKCYDLIHQFQQLLWQDQIEFYAGIGIGLLSTPIDKDIRKMDGPCFHFARQAIDIAKHGNKKKMKKIYSKNNRVFFQSLDDASIIDQSNTLEEAAVTVCSQTESIPIVEMINILIENNEILKSNLTPKQKKVYVDYIKIGSYRKMLELNRDGVQETIGGISQKINNAEYFTIQRNHNMVTYLIKYCINHLRSIF